MPSHHIARRLKKYVRNRVYQLAGRDPVTGEALARRADMSCIGTRYGGWSVPVNMLNTESICYCVGCGEDISFDLGLIDQFGCSVNAFDPTPRAIEHVKRHAAGNLQYQFSAVGLWDKPERLKFYAPSNPQDVSHSLLNLQKTREFIEVPVERLSAIMRRNGHAKLDLLKLDIEGAEYKVLDSIFADALTIAVLCVEFDEYWNPMDEGYLQRISSYVRQIIARGYLMVDAPGNGNYTFVKKAVD